MAVTTLDPLNIILFNIYLVMILQLALNWESSDCGTKSYLYQLGFIILMTLRLLFQELFNNAVMAKKLFVGSMFLTSGVLLLALGAYQSYVIATNSSNFYYDADTKSGNEACFQNRIVFVGEIIIGFLTLFKDIYFICIAKEESCRTE